MDSLGGFRVRFHLCHVLSDGICQQLIRKPLQELHCPHSLSRESNDTTLQARDMFQQASTWATGKVHQVTACAHPRGEDPSCQETCRNILCSRLSPSTGLSAGRSSMQSSTYKRPPPWLPRQLHLCTAGLLVTSSNTGHASIAAMQ